LSILFLDFFSNLLVRVSRHVFSTAALKPRPSGIFLRRSKRSENFALALAHLQLARVRRDAADRAAQLWIERRQAQALWIVARTRESCFALLRATAALVALTGGLFRDAAAREEAACAGEGR